MDLQGTRIGSTNQGTKNKSDPAAYQHPVQEPTGPVASDSLAAESARSGGDFSSNPNSTPSSVPGSKSTLANTDTSAATTLQPAPDAVGREEQDAWRETADLRGSAGGVKYAEGLGGQPDFPGAHVPSGYRGGPSGASGGNAGNASYSSSGAEPGREVAAGSADGAAGEKSKPKGRNLQEGGFEGEGANVSGKPAEIGSDMDPGRAALQSFENRNSAAQGGGAAGREGEVGGTGGYDALGSDQQA